MTAKQNVLYWQRWGAVARALKAQGLPAKEVAARRHELHGKALRRHASDAPVSHLEFTNREFDKVLGVFAAVADAGNLNAQLRQIEQPRIRVLHSLQECCRSLDVPWPAYVEGVARKMNLDGPVELLPVEDLEKILIGLKLQVRREVRKVEPQRTPKTQSGKRIYQLRPFDGNRLVGKGGPF